ncbi:hypothetical protein AMAG_08289 [Allomyces macrogynus ATCC 38327]|uniref:CH-like domain-containing protein n=1 Tax=Allomyces macrogynus (strain ATCC 38327) TaxID=578462 RepID=A0A0L0SKN9_ALLM3|nr:hypothetical protein AMAG_08289 [Allomyces macrogynus ATCC 38327]|eukprot:KNE63126.1 hypothetical protein AMAG_08289 [Allomyces macrogynus ATCC 38327]
MTPPPPPRECLQWLRALNLDVPVSATTLANGYLVGAIFERYYPPRVPPAPAHTTSPLTSPMRHNNRAHSPSSPTRRRPRAVAGRTYEPFALASLQNGCSTACKARNWHLIRRYLATQLALDLTDDVVFMVISGHRDLAWAILCECYEVLTGKRLPNDDPIHQRANLDDVPAPPVFSHTTLPPLPTSAPGTPKRTAARKANLPRASPQQQKETRRDTYLLPTAASTLRAVPDGILASASDRLQLHDQVLALVRAHEQRIHDVVHAAAPLARAPRSGTPAIGMGTRTGALLASPGRRTG